MKKSLLTLAGTLFVMSAPIVNATPVIEFTGEVSKQTCVPTINGSENGSVLLPTVVDTELAEAGSTAGQTTFNIDLPGGCADATGIVLNGHNVEDGILGNNATGINAATNVGLEMLKSTGQAIVLDGSTTVPVKVENGKTSLGVQYKATGEATTGKVKGTAEYTISYN